MKISATIAEYNPLHLGHEYHLSHVRSLGDATIVLMAGNFVQRGEAAILDKYTRARHAILAGADLVVELPTAYAVSCAEQYARGAIKLFAALNQDCVLSFGSECGDVHALQTTADLLSTEIPEINQRIQAHMAEGISFPTARQMAVTDYANRHGIELVDLTSPNNILGIEYARANNMLGHPLTLDTIKRTFAYHDKEVSASAIREGLGKGIDLAVNPTISADLANVHPINSVLYLSAWRDMTKEQAALLWGAEEGLQNRIWECAAKAATFEQAMKLTATKRYTTARIRRLATAGLLGLTDQTWRHGDSLPPYFNVLALKEDRKDLLSLLAHHGDVYTSRLDLEQSDHPFAKLDAKADHVFELLRSVKMPTHFSLV